ncbi:MAG: hypothetical protein Q7U05_04820 [Polaromonas sp.]|nr:hypothetical protein [Polaromonas sp.]
MQNISNSSIPASAVIDNTAQAEAARYALLRRLAPAIRHHLVGEFQPIGMVATMLDRRLQTDTPNLSQLRESSAALGKLSRTAANTCMNLMTWLAPKTGAVTRLDSGVLDCLSLLITEFRFRGFVIVNEIADLPVEVSLMALRSVLPGALLALSDQQPGPADFVLKAIVVGDGVALSMRRRPAERSAENSPSTDYRALTWLDVAALAQAESVGFAPSADAVELRFSAARQTSGLEA